MKAGLGLLLIAVLPLGCASTSPSAPAPAAPRMTPSPIAPASSPPLSPPPQVSPRMENEDKAVRDVNARLARAGQLVAQIDPSKLGQEQREMLSGLQDFISKAADALQARDVPRAQILADKASSLADNLLLALKNLKPAR